MVVGRSVQGGVSGRHRTGPGGVEGVVGRCVAPLRLLVDGVKGVER